MTRPVYDTPAEAMRAVLAAGNTPCLRGRIVRSRGLDVDALALELGACVRYDRERDTCSFMPGD